MDDAPVMGPIVSGHRFFIQGRNGCSMAASRKTSRRQFLRGQSAAGSIQDVAAAIGKHNDEICDTPALEIAHQETDGYLTRFGRRAMACEFEVLLNSGQYSQGAETALAVLDLVDELESQLTVYRNESELSQINQHAYAEAVPMEARLFALLKQAAQIHSETGGAYDITSGPLSKIWGFHRRAGRVPPDAELVEAQQRVGLQYVEFDAQRLTLKFQKPGMELNLGSIGKGYALDRAAELLIAADIQSFLLHGGNSSVLAAGNRSNGFGWWIGLRHPMRPQRRIGEIQLSNRALGTSGSGTQFFVHNNRRYGHILDPRVGRPAEGVLSVTVAAQSGAEADALATAFYVMGRPAAIEYCRQHPGVSAVIMSAGTESQEVDVTLWGFCSDEIRLYPDQSLGIEWVER
jgi:thiamine biosynthesis lipoprotein